MSGDLSRPGKNCAARPARGSSGVEENLPTFTFRQVGVKAMEIQAVPGPEARAWRGKTMRHRSFLGPGGQAVLCLGTGVFRCRGSRPGARAARPILRKPRRISGWNSFPADAFSAPCPCFRATSSVWSRSEIQKVGKFVFCIDEEERRIVYYIINRRVARVPRINIRPGPSATQSRQRHAPWGIEGQRG